VLEILDSRGESIALVMLPGIQYYSGQLFDMPAITTAARARGCRVGWDLAHAIGNVPLALHDWDADFAVWCSYKYLNGGPGAVAGCFVHERHGQDPDLPRFAGWWGHEKATRFRMDPEFRPSPGAEGWQLSNPPIFSMAPLIPALGMFMEAGMDRLAAKSARLTGWLEELIRIRLGQRIEILTPGEPEQRGCQLSLRVKPEGPTGHEVFERLSAAGIVVDWREPDVIRAAPVPLYNTYRDVAEFVRRLEEALS
jgi:kynureninase